MIERTKWRTTGEEVQKTSERNKIGVERTKENLGLRVERRSK